MSGADLPPDLRGLDARLRAVAFTPRQSLGPEIDGRIARGESAPRRRSRGPRVAALALLLLAGLGAGAWWAGREGPQPLTVDRCCIDLDGGGGADDGVVVVTRKGVEVQALLIYEDLDRSGGYSETDLVRFERGAPLTIGSSPPEQALTRRFCCHDYDGGGPADDGLIVVATHPNRVLMAAIYETADHRLR